MTNLNTQDEIYRFNTLKPIANLNDEDLKQKDFREIILGAKKEDKEQDLWLRLLDLDSNLLGKPGQKHWLNLYLGRSKTFEKGKSPKKYNIIVPIIPRCYATPNRDPAEAIEVPEGWLYVIRKFKSHQGTVVELWRELKSDGRGNFSDVNLKRFKGKDQRTATGQPGFRVIVPYCIDKQVHELWIAYSEVQWSWARVQSMKKDADLRDRRMHRLDVSDCLENFANSHYDDSASAKESGARQSDPAGNDFTNISASKYLQPDWRPGSPDSSNSANNSPNAFILEEVEVSGQSNTAWIYNLRSAPDSESIKLTKDLKDAIPVVYLDNPVGIAKSLGAIYQYACKEMKDYVSLLKDAPQLLQDAFAKNMGRKNGSKEKPSSQDSRLKELGSQPYALVRWFESAVVLNRYLYTGFPDKPPHNWTKEEKLDFPQLKAKAEEKFLNYRAKIDKADLEKALGTEKRAKLRENIKKAKAFLSDFLNQELVNQGEESALLQALDDYFTLPAQIVGAQPIRKKVAGEDITIWPDCYADGWKAVTAIIRYLDKHIYTHDKDLIAPAPDGWSLRKNDPGVKLLALIADPQESLPIHQRLFPKWAENIHPLAFDKSPVKCQDPHFKFKHFERLAKSELGRAADTVTNFLRQFEEIIAMTDRKDAAFVQRIERIRDNHPRLINAVLQTNLEKVHVPLPDLLAFKQEDASDFQGIRRPALAIGKAAQARFEDANEAMKKKVDSVTDISLKFDSEGKHVQTVKTAKGSEYTLKKVVLTRTGDATGVTDLKVTSSVGEDVNLRTTGVNNYTPKQRLYNLTAVMLVDEDVRDRLVERIGHNEAAIRAVGGLLTVVETINLVSSLQAVMTNKNDDKRGERFADLFSSFCDLGSALENMVDSAHSFHKADLSKGIPKGTIPENVTNATKAAQWIKVIGYIGSAIDLGLTLESLIENYQQNDDAYIGDSIMLVGFAITALADVEVAAAPLAALLGLSVAWITVIGLLVLLVGYLVKRLIFPEDSYFEIWLANGPFACGEGTHPHFRYSRQTATINVYDPNGNSVPKTCTKHCYDNDWLYVDSEGNLVDIGKPSGHRGMYPKFRKNAKGQVFLMAGKHPDTKKDTVVGTIGQPYHPHPLLQTQTTPGKGRFGGHKPGDDPMKYAQIPRAAGHRHVDDPNPDQHSKYRFAVWCEYPQEAYNALMDALYRPAITSNQVMRKQSGTKFTGEVTLHIHTPFLLPKSNLFIQFWRLKSDRVKSIFDPDFKTTLTDEDMIESYSISTYQVDEGRNQHPSKTNPTIKDLEDGPNRYTLRFTNHHTTYCKLKVRIDLFGDGKTCLPCEPLFCGSDINEDQGQKADKKEKSTTTGVPDMGENTTEATAPNSKNFRWVELEKFFIPEWR